MTTSSRRRWIILGASYLMVVGAGLPYIGWTPQLTTIADELSLSYTQAGTLASVTALTGGVALLLGGAAIARLGCRNVILLGLATAVIGQLMFSYATGYGSALLARALCGVAVGLLFVGPYTMAVTWFRETRQTGIAVGVMLSADGIGSVCALYLLATTLTVLGWRTGLAVEAGYLLVLFVIALVLLRNAPAAGGEPGTGAAGRTYARVLRALAQRNVLSAITFYMGGWGLFALVASWMPAILVEDAGWSESQAGLFVSFFSLGGIVTAVGCGLYSDRIGRRKVFVLLAGTTVTALVGALGVCLATGNHVLAVVLLPLIGLGVYAGTPLALALANESVESEHVGAVNGIVLGCAFLIGGFVYPYALGGIKDATGSYATGFFAVTAATAVLCVLVPLFGRDLTTQERSALPHGGHALT